MPASASLLTWLGRVMIVHSCLRQLSRLDISLVTGLAVWCLLSHCVVLMLTTGAIDSLIQLDHCSTATHGPANVTACLDFTLGVYNCYLKLRQWRLREIVAGRLGSWWDLGVSVMHKCCLCQSVAACLNPPPPQRLHLVYMRVVRWLPPRCHTVCRRPGTMLCSHPLTLEFHTDLWHVFFLCWRPP